MMRQFVADELRKLVMSPLLLLFVVLPLMGQVATGPKKSAKTYTTQAHVESREHAYARKQIEEATAKVDELSRKSNVYGKLSIATEPSVLCTFDNPNDYSHWWRDCHYNLKKASELIGVSEDTLKQAITAYCSDIAFYDKASACHDKASELLKDVTAQMEAIDVLGMMHNLQYVDPCAAVYRATIDKKTSELTVRQTEQVKACRSKDLYPPPK